MEEVLNNVTFFAIAAFVILIKTVSYKKTKLIYRIVKKEAFPFTSFLLLGRDKWLFKTIDYNRMVFENPTQECYINTQKRSIKYTLYIAYLFPGPPTVQCQLRILIQVDSSSQTLRLDKAHRSYTRSYHPATATRSFKFLFYPLINTILSFNHSRL